MDSMKQIFNDLSAEAKKQNAQLEVLISGGESLNLSYKKKNLDKFESKQTQMAGIRVLKNNQQGYAYTENLSADAMALAFKEALNNLSGTSQSQLVKPNSDKNSIQEMQSKTLNPENIEMDQKLAAAKALEEQCYQKDPRVQSVPYSGFSEGMYFTRVLNSEGLDQEFKQSFYSGYSYPMAKEGESSKMDGDSFFARSFKDINVEDVTTTSVQRATSKLGASKLKTGNYAVVIDREQVPMILSMIHGYFSAKSVFENKSLFKDKLGQKVGSGKLNLIDDPFYLESSSARPFDSEGAASQKTQLIENGTLKNYLTNLEYAEKMKLPHTAHASRSPASAMDISPSNLIIAKGDQSLEQLLSKFENTVYLTEFAGGLHAGFKSSTGDISMPGEGFLYKNGKRIGPVDQFVMSGNVLELLQNIEEIGNHYNKAGNSMVCPDLLIRSMSFAGGE